MDYVKEELKTPPPPPRFVTVKLKDECGSGEQGHGEGVYSD